MGSLRVQTPIANANNVAAGITGTWDVPVGRRYHDIQMEYSGVTLAQMTEIRIYLNGEVIHRLSATERDTINQFDKKQPANGILVLPFDRDNLYSQQGEELTAIQTGPDSVDKNGVFVGSFKIEIDFAAGAYTPVVTLTASTSDNDPSRPGPGWILRTLKYPRALNITGENEISDLPSGAQGPKFALLNRTHFFSAAIQKLEIKRSNVTLFKRSLALNARKQIDGVRSAQAGVYTFDTTEEGYDYGGLELINATTKRAYQDFRFIATTNGPDTACRIVQEYMGTLGA